MKCHCLTCHADARLVFRQVSEMPVYNLVPPRGWLIVPEQARQPLSFFCLCPDCKRAFGPTPVDVDAGSRVVSVRQ